MPSPHETYARQLKALSTDGAAFAALRAAGSSRGWWSPQAEWSRTFGRFNPSEPAFASVVYETLSAGRMLAQVDVYEDAPVAGDSLVTLVEDVGFVRVAPFTHDPRLATLGAFLEDHPDAAVVRYRPGKRCTLRVGHNGHPRRYAKLFPDDAGRRLHDTGVDLWRAFQRGELGFAVAEPDRWDGRTRALWQHEVRGVPVLAGLCGGGGAELARRMGAAAASLTRSRVKPSQVFDAAAQMERSESYALGVGRRVPRLSMRVAELMERLRALHAGAPARPPVPIHGAPHANQWLENGSTLGLVDFDRISRGDPELDVATFLGELDFEDGLRIPVETIAAAFLDGYEAVAGRLRPELLRAYRAHKRLAKVLRSARALRPDGDARAERHLNRAFESLDRL